MLYRYKIKPLSPVITPLMSDTFFGHFCWALVYEKGEKYLEAFIDSFNGESKAPVLFSSAFPEGFLPRPVLPKVNRRESAEFIKKHFKDGKKDRVSKERQFEGLNFVKKAGKFKYISLEQWKKLKDGYSEPALLNLFYESFVDKSDEELHVADMADISVSEVVSSNVINRITGSVDSSGGLFVRQKSWFYPESCLDIYIEINDSGLEELVDWFMKEHLALNGFGADKSTGMGSLLIEKDNNFDEREIAAEEPNARFSLSLASFPGMEKYPSYYNLTTKFGRLGGTYAVSSPTGGQPRPFKKPILMCEPGALFFTEKNISKEQLLSDVHYDERIRHNGIPVTIPVRLKEAIV